MLCRDRLCAPQQLWPRKQGWGDRRDEAGDSCHRLSHTTLLRVSLTLTGDSSVKVASGKMKATSRCVAMASVEDAAILTLPPSPRGQTLLGRGIPEHMHPRLRLGVCFRRGK